MTPEISVVIPHFNRLQLLKQAVASVRASRFASYEMIVVDDGSDAACKTELAAFSSEDLRILDRAGSKGPSSARNTGARSARGEFLLFLDSDDMLAPWCLEQRWASIEEFPANDLWIFPVLLFDETPGDRSTLWNDMDNGHRDDLRFAQSDAPWHTSSPMWRRSAFLNLGGFNQRIMYGDDSDLHLRAVLGKLRIAKFPAALPDVFVRRSNEDRITSGMKAEVMESRLVRLAEESRLLLSSETAELRRVFEGQYFAEAEFLLFNAPDPSAGIARVLKQWGQDYPFSRNRRLASLYLRVALEIRDSFYLGLRIARRMIRTVLPQSFFPTGGGIEATVADPETMQGVLAELARHRL
jgi:glycosyltransferase involved in cell wall biosynthesis